MITDYDHASWYEVRVGSLRFGVHRTSAEAFQQARRLYNEPAEVVVVLVSEERVDE